MDYRSRPIRIVESVGGCMVPVSHKLNHDGYFRKLWGNSRDGKVHEMFHRFIYRAHNDLEVIPDGFEVDHMCKTRACCNPKHLQLLEGTVHTIQGNATRYLARNLVARSHWMETGCTGTVLSELFGVAVKTACGWIKAWKAEALEAPARVH